MYKVVMKLNIIRCISYLGIIIAAFLVWSQRPLIIANFLNIKEAGTLSRAISRISLGIPCEMNGGRQLYPRHSSHCECEGHKITIQPMGTDMGTIEDCVGHVVKEWEVVYGIQILFDVAPPTSSVSIMGAKLHGRPDRMASNGQFTIENIGESRTVNGVPHGVNRVGIDRVYEIHDGKLNFQDRSPIHIEISNPGYKTWKTDIVPETDPIEIKVKLEPNAT